MSDNFKRRTVLVLLFLLLAVPGALVGSEKRFAKVMTWNMDAGTDLGFIFVYLGTNPELGAQLTYEEVLNSHIRERADYLADQIAAEKPYLVSLQEVTLWQTISLADGSTTVVADQLELLTSALAVRRQRYEVVAVNKLTEAVAPLDSALGLSFTDRDVILARSDLKQSELDLSNIQTRRYATAFSFLGIPSLRGWMSVDAKVRGKTLRFVNTHLESPNPFSPEAATVQVVQANELIQALRTTNLPVVLAGDFNSDAESGPGPDNTITAANIVAAGYTDTWRSLRPADHGFTWPLFWEDFYSGVPIVPFERIDLIFTRDLDIADVQRLGADAPYPSDHAGVVATLGIDQ